MFFAGRLYLSAQIFSLAGVPVTMPASRHSLVVWSAGAIWFVLRLPKPRRAKPSFRVDSCAAAEGARFNMGAAIAAAPQRSDRLMNCRRDCPVWSRFAFLMKVITLLFSRSKNFAHG